MAVVCGAYDGRLWPPRMLRRSRVYIGGGGGTGRGSGAGGLVRVAFFLLSPPGTRNSRCPHGHENENFLKKRTKAPPANFNFCVISSHEPLAADSHTRPPTTPATQQHSRAAQSAGPRAIRAERIPPPGTPHQAYVQYACTNTTTNTNPPPTNTSRAPPGTIIDLVIGLVINLVESVFRSVGR